MTDTPKDIWVGIEDEHRMICSIYPVKEFDHFTLNNEGTLRETVECVECKGSGEMSDEQDTPPWKCLFCNGTGKRVKP